MHNCDISFVNDQRLCYRHIKSESIYKEVTKFSLYFWFCNVSLTPEWVWVGKWDTRKQELTSTLPAVTLSYH